MAREGVDRDQLAGVARAALGAGHRLIGVSRLRGGSKKGVYRLAFDDGSTAIVYVWNDAENYWAGARACVGEDHADPFSPAGGLGLFEAAHRRLDALGIRTPRIHLTDRSKAHYPADIAVLEDVPGENLETRLRRDPHAGEVTFARLAETLGVMRRQQGPSFGKIALIDGGGRSRGSSCEQVVLDRALEDLTDAASRDARVERVRPRLRDLVRGLATAVRPPRTRKTAMPESGVWLISSVVLCFLCSSSRFLRFRSFVLERLCAVAFGSSMIT